jgi:plastocyanin
VAVPRLDVEIDKPTVSTELASSNMVTVTFQASGGFSGAVNLTATAVDAGGAPITGWTVVLNSATVNIAENGTGSAVATLQIPGNATALTGKVKIDVVSSLGTVSKTSDVTALKQITLNITESPQGACVYPTTNKDITIKTGTKVRFTNKFTTQDNIIIHGNGVVPHENIAAGGNGPNGAYELTFNTAGNGSWYCHSPGPDLGNNNPKVVVQP